MPFLVMLKDPNVGGRFPLIAGRVPFCERDALQIGHKAARSPWR
jgi:hypothetical protein